MKQRRFACLSSLCLLALVGCGETSVPIHKSQTPEAGSSATLAPAESSSPVNPASSPTPSESSSATSYLPAESILFFTGFVDYYTGMGIRITKPSGDDVALTYPSYHEDAESYDITIEKQVTDWEDGRAKIKANGVKMKEFLAAKHYDPALADSWLKGEQEEVEITLPATYFFSLAIGSSLSSQERFTFLLSSGAIAKGDKVAYVKSSTGKAKEYTLPSKFATGENRIYRDHAQTGTVVSLVPSTAISYSEGNVGTAVFYSPGLSVKSSTKMTMDLTIASDFTYSGSGNDLSYCFHQNREFSDDVSFIDGLESGREYKKGEVVEGVKITFRSRFSAYEGAKVSFFRFVDENKPILFEASVHFAS